ncbi:MAG: carbon-nitrogen hydrolase family protein [Desulfobacterales bacterium]|nr:MAG: carbon-nitrogen hydrolase family protein [Desulfobacterales bacterium]
MGRTIAIAGVQMEVRQGQDNRARMHQLIKTISSNFGWVELIVFSELCVFGGDLQYAELIPGPTSDSLCNLAAQHGKWLIPGSQFEKDEDKIYNTAMVISPDGGIVAKYRKMFPWRPIEKNDRGRDFCVFDIPDCGRFGLAICYDQWFPEVIRTLAWMGAEVVLHPTMTTTSDRVIELSLSQANAAFNQLYFISINGVGGGGNGRSLFVDPDGRILQTAGEAEAVLTEIIDLDHVTRTREQGTIGLCHPLRELQEFPFEFPPYKEGLARGQFFHKVKS